jgi:hypothetical protein
LDAVALTATGGCTAADCCSTGAWPLYCWSDCTSNVCTDGNCIVLRLLIAVVPLPAWQALSADTAGYQCCL